MSILARRKEQKKIRGNPLLFFFSTGFKLQRHKVNLAPMQYNKTFSPILLGFSNNPLVGIVASINLNRLECGKCKQDNGSSGIMGLEGSKLSMHLK